MLSRPQIITRVACIAGLYLLISAASVFASQEPRFSSKYENPAIYGGLFYVVRSSGGYVIDSADGYDERALVISYNDEPIERKPNDPDAPTLPGFYLTYKVRFDFERVEVIGKKVYFKTRGIGGVSYEFKGISGEEVIPNFNPSIRVPFIKGILTRLRDGKVMSKEEIKFGHAVVA